MMSMTEPYRDVGRLKRGLHHVGQVGADRCAVNLAYLAAGGGESVQFYDFLAGRGSFVNLDNYRPECLPIFSRDVLRRIAASDDAWETMVPEQVAELIKRRGFFGYVKPGARD